MDDSASQWATDLRTEKRQAYDPYPVVDWFSDPDEDDSGPCASCGGDSTDDDHDSVNCWKGQG